MPPGPIFPENSAFTPRHMRELKNRTKALFNHGWNAYRSYGFPADEVRPVSCEPYGPQYSEPDSNHRDAMGNVSLTVLDNIDTLMMLGEWDELAAVLRYLECCQDLFFAQDHVVQVFEASIRWVGGLLLAHLALTEGVLAGTRTGHAQDASETRFARLVAHYDGFLLRMAYDLGLRLIPAYNTSTSLPLARINLKRGLAGMQRVKNVVGCTAGASTPLLEFTLLLRLTGDTRFETLTNRTFWKLWDTRLELGLLPMTLDPAGNRWLDVVSGIGALIDSFYEYSLKASIVLQDAHLGDVFALSYDALMAHLAVWPARDSWMLFANVHVSRPARVNMWVDLLSAFWPGLQVLAGRLSDAVSTHLTYLKIWDHYDSLPERWEQQSATPPEARLEERVNAAISLEWYPLRPEFIESTYYLYRATRDPMYLQIGVRVLSLFETQYKTTCGFSGFQDIRTGTRQNRMESFVLGELLLYLYLLFDTANESYVHRPAMDRRNWVFSTEAHPLWYCDAMGRRSRARFRQYLSLIVTEHTKFENGFSRSMWREIAEIGDAHVKLRTRVPPHEPTSMFGSRLSPVLHIYNFCETAPRQWAAVTRFLSSGFCSWDHVFMLNFHLASTLVRPAHLGYSNNSVIELTLSFLDTYCLGGRLQTARPATTTDLDFAIGTLARPEAYEMYRVDNSGSAFAKDDLVMPRFFGRVRLEQLLEHAVTRENTLVLADYLLLWRQLWHGDYQLVLIHTVNGHAVGARNTLWTEGDALLDSLLIFLVSALGNVIIDGMFVENFKAF
ncbi:seven-hairpin glycosidase [Metschnikowia bicuspidata]|uniref:alpha-1,2-Mannosidase n=1 Tax=Metschnikowia bicuspidata TaxID=27322 RepID=A0A4V1J319_9ASCO|nr:seven-hairpin glycosidase [Metschnikowia bicuspidata]